MSSGAVRPPANLLEEYYYYVQGLRGKWLADNRPRSNTLYELMSEHERAQVHRVITRWADYITPLAEEWWEKRGYGIVWPSDDSQPQEYYELEHCAGSSRAVGS